MTPSKAALSKLARHDGLVRRLNLALVEQKAASGARPEMAFGSWLRRMAGSRREVAAIYRAAANEAVADSLEWHGFTDAAILLEQHAAANLAHADTYDRATPVKADTSKTVRPKVSGGVA